MMRTDRSVLFASLASAVYLLSLCWFAYVYLNGLADRALFYNSDALFLPSIFKNIFSEGKHFADWLLPPSFFLFPDALVYALAYISDKQAVVQIGVFAVLQSLLFFVSSVFLLNSFLRRSYAIAYSALISSNIIFIGLYTADPYGLSFISVFHFGSLLSFMLLAALWLKFLSATTAKAKFYSGSLAVLVAACSVISDRLILLHFVAPILLIGVFLYFAEPKRKDTLTFGILLIAGFLFAFVLEKLFLPRMGGLKYEIGFGSLINKSMMLANWAIDQPVLVQLSLLLLPASLVVAGFFLYRNRKATDTHVTKQNLIAALILVSTALAFLVTGLSGRDFAIRYLLPYIFLPPLFLFILLSGRQSRVLAILIFCSSLLAVFTAQVSGKKPFRLYPDVVQCVDALAQKHKVTRGIAQYWDAIPVYVLSNAGLNVVPVLNDGSPMMWLYNSSDFAGEFSFVIIDNSASDFYRISRRAIEQQLSNKAFEYQCLDKTVLIFNSETISLPQQSDVSKIRSSAVESFIRNPRALLIMAQEESKKGNREAAARLHSEAIALLRQSGARKEIIEYYEAAKEDFSYKIQ